MLTQKRRSEAFANDTVRSYDEKDDANPLQLDTDELKVVDFWWT